MKKFYTVNSKADGETLGELETDGTLESCLEYVKKYDYSPADVMICEWTNDGEDICTDIIEEW